MSFHSARHMRRLICGAVVVALSTIRGDAQAQGVSRFAIDVAGGIGTGRGGEFKDPGLLGRRVAGSMRFPQAAKTAAYAEVGYDELGVPRGHDAVGIFSTRGGFKHDYPEFSGPIVMVGVIRTLGAHVEARAAVGGGAYKADGPRVGALVTHVDLAAFPLRHIGIVASGRMAAFPKYQHDHLRIYQAALGLRVR